MPNKEHETQGPRFPSDGPFHASSVSYKGQGVLILGKSGAGKSTLALELMSRGATLIADDRTVVAALGNEVLLSAPEALQGRIEARGVGILRTDYAGPTPLKLIVDLDRVEDQRLPQFHTIQLSGKTFPLILNVPQPHFPAAILQYLSHGRSD